MSGICSRTGSTTVTELHRRNCLDLRDPVFEDFT
jgi:hypothetical protein